MVPLDDAAAAQLEVVTEHAPGDGAAKAAATWTNPREERIVFDQLHRLVPALEEGLARSLPPGITGFTKGVFCHQTPMVDFSFNVTPG